MSGYGYATLVVARGLHRSMCKAAQNCGFIAARSFRTLVSHKVTKAMANSTDHTTHTMLAPQHREIIAGLLHPTAQLSPKYFYDDLGSRLFEEITQLPEYYPTRTERGIFETHGAEIAAAVGTNRTLIELGAGSCEKAADLCELIAPKCFVGVDISAHYLERSVARLHQRFPDIEVHAVGGDITCEIALPEAIAQTGRLIFYPGSSIGNFDPAHALKLLQQMRELAGDDGGLLIGFDLPKDTAVLQAAYDDSEGVTAKFNLNALDHVNRLIGGDFDTTDWQHRALFNVQESRIEMHLEARKPVQVRWPGGSRSFSAGERIHTENSYKYPLDVFRDMLKSTGFTRAQSWTDSRAWFAVVYAQP